MGGDLDTLLAFTEPADLAVDLIARVRLFKGPGAKAAADQIVRAAESIHANVAEAYGRGFNGHGVQMLFYARGSAAELVGHITVSTRAGRFSPEEGAGYLRRLARIRALINGLIKRYAHKK